MLACVLSCAILGLDGAIVHTQVDVTNGLPSFIVVGLPDTAVQESRERVQAAVKNAGLTFPHRRVTVNLAPASLRKEGPAYDLPIALGVLVPGVEVIPIEDLAQLAAHPSGRISIAPLRTEPALIDADRPPLTDFSEARGQEHVKRALEVAAAGAHNVLMSGPPGAGRTLLARALPSILPRLTLDEALDVTRIYSVAEMLPAEMPLLTRRPFRGPHHTISHAGQVGGGNWPRPGEISLSHRGVLFLDELPEFSLRVLEVLHQPLEDKVVTISRAHGTLTFPANFMLVAAMNPCLCGYAGDPVRACTCAPSSITRYQKRISGPLLDCIDIHVEVPRVEYSKLTDPRPAKWSATTRERVQAARERQRERFAGTDLAAKADMRPAKVRRFCELDEAGTALLRTAMAQLQLTARSFHRMLKISRTIADLSGAEVIRPAHLAEALQYRPRQVG
jgi:magnesium chelatase family protein